MATDQPDVRLKREYVPFIGATCEGCALDIDGLECNIGCEPEHPLFCEGKQEAWIWKIVKKQK